MNSKYLAVVGFFVFFQFIEVAYGQKPCIVTYTQEFALSDICFWGSRDAESCKEARDYLFREASCKQNGAGDRCNFSITGCTAGLGTFANRCDDIGGEKATKFKVPPAKGQCV